jgi:hypothetical protein
MNKKIPPRVKQPYNIAESLMNHSANMLYYPENMAKIKKLNSKAIPLKTNYS